MICSWTEKTPFYIVILNSDRFCVCTPEQNCPRFEDDERRPFLILAAANCHFTFMLSLRAIKNNRPTNIGDTTKRHLKVKKMAAILESGCITF